MSYLNWSGGKTVINYPEMNLKNVKIAFVRVHILWEGLAKSWTVMSSKKIECYFTQLEPLGHRFAIKMILEQGVGVAQV